MTLTKKDVIDAALRAVELGSSVDDAFEPIGLSEQFRASIGTTFFIDRSVVPSFDAWMYGTVWAEVIRPAHALQLHRLYDNRAARKRSRMRRRGGR